MSPVVYQQKGEGKVRLKEGGNGEMGMGRWGGGLRRKKLGCNVEEGEEE